VFCCGFFCLLFLHLSSGFFLPLSIHHLFMISMPSGWCMAYTLCIRFFLLLRFLIPSIDFFLSFTYFCFFFSLSTTLYLRCRCRWRVLLVGGA
jgi:hypothetical protein